MKKVGARIVHRIKDLLVHNDRFHTRKSNHVDDRKKRLLVRGVEMVKWDSKVLKSQKRRVFNDGRSAVKRGLDRLENVVG